MTLKELESALRENPGNINTAHEAIEALRGELLSDASHHLTPTQGETG